MRFLSLLAFATMALGTPAAAQDRPSLFATPGDPVPSQRTVICGTTIVPANPKVDPKAVKPAPRGGFTLRLVEPSICAPRSSALRNDIGVRLPQIFGPKR